MTATRFKARIARLQAAAAGQLEKRMHLIAVDIEEEMRSQARPLINKMIADGSASHADTFVILHKFAVENQTMPLVLSSRGIQ